MNIQKKTFLQIIKYGMVGVLNTLLTLVVMFILLQWLGVSNYIANPIGYIVGFINSFVWNKFWVFKKKDKKILHDLLIFAVGFLVCFVIQYFVTIGVEYELANTESASRIIEIINQFSNTSVAMIANLIGMIVYTICNFVYNKFVTFKEKK